MFILILVLSCITALQWFGQGVRCALVFCTQTWKNHAASSQTVTAYQELCCTSKAWPPAGDGDSCTAIMRIPKDIVPATCTWPRVALWRSEMQKCSHYYTVWSPHLQDQALLAGAADRNIASAFPCPPGVAIIIVGLVQSLHFLGSYSALEK